MTIRLIAIDLYGTLVGPRGGAISAGNQDALKQALDKGIKIALVTGLNRASALKILETSRIPAWSGLMVACYNGGVMFEYANGDIVWADSHSPALSARCLAHSEIAPHYPMVHGPLDPQNLLWIQNGNHPEIITCYLRHRMELLGSSSVRVVTDLTDSVIFPVQNISVAVPEESVHRIADQLTAEFGTEIKVVKSQWKEGYSWLEILPPKAGKGEAVRRIGNQLGLSKNQIMAIGDNWNDIEMFEFAGLAVAMGNATDDVKQKASFVTLPWDKDGVAQALHHCALNQSN
jgi:hypothetical protein